MLKTLKFQRKSREQIYEQKYGSQIGRASLSYTRPFESPIFRRVFKRYVTYMLVREKGDRERGINS